MSVRFVESPSPGWVVSEAASAQELRRFATKAEAEAFARSTLSLDRAGGGLTVYRKDGTLIRRVQISGTGGGVVVPAAGDVSLLGAGRDAVTQIRREGKHVDRGLEWGADLLPLVLGPLVPAVIAPTVLEASGRGWWAVALATFTWTVGWAAIWFFALGGYANGAPLFMGAGPVLFLVSASIATWIGQGELALVRDGSVSLSGIVNNAIDAYGALGAALGFGIGFWIGSRVARHFPKESVAI